MSVSQDKTNLRQQHSFSTRFDNSKQEQNLKQLETNYEREEMSSSSSSNEENKYSNYS
jgi:hypothetical protein